MGHQPFERRVTDECGMKRENTLVTDGTEGECAFISTQLTSFQHRPHNWSIVDHITSLKEKKTLVTPNQKRKNTVLSH